MGFPNTEEIRAQADIADVVSRYIELKRGGNGRLKACCPFHDERTPSFYLYPDQHFKCFGCGRSGSVFDFVMLMESCTFIEAKDRLVGNRFLEQPQSYQRARFGDSKPVLPWRDVMAKSNVRPLCNSPGARWIEGRRGIPATVAALCGALFAGSYLSRAAVLFPIRDALEQTVAIQGRYLDGAQPKMRTCGPKMSGLFATPGALDSERFAVCEAPLDAISLHLFGMPAVATCGNGLTEWLANFVDERIVYLAPDNDVSGENNVLLWRETLEQGGAMVKRLAPPIGKDWNDTLRAVGWKAARQGLQPSWTNSQPNHCR